MTPEQEHRLEIALSSFVEQYEMDMRGNKKLNGGARGVIGNIRELKDTVAKIIEEGKENPSLIWLLKNKPAKTVGVILASYSFLELISRNTPELLEKLVAWIIKI